MEEVIKQFLAVSYGYGSGSGDGSGSGSGIKSYNGHEVYRIDDMQTIIYSVHGNIARGATINSDLSLADCYIAKCRDYFAHGETAKQAMADAQSKAWQNKPIEDRIDLVVSKYPDVDAQIEHSTLFSLHNFLTGSCLFGRQEFAKSHSLDPNHGTMTMREFIHLTKDAFGGDNIRQLADAYKIKLQNYMTKQEVIQRVINLQHAIEKYQYITPNIAIGILSRINKMIAEIK